MLESFIYSFNSVAPIFLLVLVGMFLKKIKFLNQDFCSIADKLVFKVALPMEMFLSVSGTDLDTIFTKENAGLIGFFIIGIVLAFAILCLVSPPVLKSNYKCGAFIQGSFRGNFAIFALPLTTNMFGDAGKIAATMMMPIVTIMFNILAVTGFGIFAPKEGKKKKSEMLKEILISIVKNPLIIGIMIGFAFSILRTELKVTVPSFALKSLDDISSLAIPLALLSIGVNFNPQNLKGRIGTAMLSMSIKNIILPVIAVSIGVLMGYRGIELSLLLVSFGSPTSVSSYIMAKNMHSDYELAGQILLLTTVFSLLTMFLFIFVLKQFAFI